MPYLAFKSNSGAGFGYFNCSLALSQELLAIISLLKKKRKTVEPFGAYVASRNFDTP